MFFLFNLFNTPISVELYFNNLTPLLLGIFCNFIFVLFYLFFHPTNLGLTWGFGASAFILGTEVAPKRWGHIIQSLMTNIL